MGLGSGDRGGGSDFMEDDMVSRPSTATVHDADQVRLERLDAEIASLRQRLAAKEREQSDLAARWGYSRGYRARVSADQMRLSINAEKRDG